MTAFMREYVALFPALVAVSWIVLGSVFVLRREWRLPLDPGFTPAVAVVVPAHNEELVIEATLEALLNQEYPALQIHVVSDGSTDATVEIARRFEGHGVVVHELTTNVGKSAALQHVLDRVDAELFMVVDADTRSRPTAISMLVQHMSDPRVGAVTGHAQVGNVVNPLTATQAMEYSVIVGLAKRAEQIWGGLYTVSGAAACFRSSALRAVGGWSDATVTEDIEVSWRLQRAGWTLAYDPRAVFLIQAPERLRALVRQRRRWAQGMVEVLRLHWGVGATRNRALLPVATQVVGAAVWMGFAVVLLAQSALSWAGDGFDGAALAALLETDRDAVLIWTIGLFGMQTLVASIFDGAHAGGGWRVLPLFIIFPVYFWLVVFPSFLLGAARGLGSTGTAQWARTERSPIRDDAAVGSHSV